MELRALAYFVTACRSLSLAHGAGRLGIAVSTLSAVLKSVEDDTDVVLFHRRNNALYPNGAAVALIRAIEPLLMAEQFARRWLQASPRANLKILRVEIALTHTVGGVAAALRRAAETFGAERPDVLIDPVWIDERDRPPVPPLTESNHQTVRSVLRIGIGASEGRTLRGDIDLLDDRWVFASRLPAGTRTPPRAAEFAAGRLIVPLLSPTLIDQADRYLSRHRFPNVRFVDDHPVELPRLIDERPDAALFVPRTVTTARLGLANITTVEPDEPLRLRLTARPLGPGSMSGLFAEHLRSALSEGETHVERTLIDSAAGSLHRACPAAEAHRLGRPRRQRQPASAQPADPQDRGSARRRSFRAPRRWRDSDRTRRDDLQRSLLSSRRDPVSSPKARQARRRRGGGSPSAYCRRSASTDSSSTASPTRSSACRRVILD